MSYLTPPASWFQPAPPPNLDGNLVQRTLHELVQAHNSHNGDMHMLRTEMTRMRGQLDDLLELVKFLATNPDKSIGDWARYEAVKEKFKEVV
jgi:hypothetical protein